MPSATFSLDKSTRHTSIEVLELTWVTAWGLTMNQLVFVCLPGTFAESPPNHCACPLLRDSLPQICFGLCADELPDFLYFGTQYGFEVRSAMAVLLSEHSQPAAPLRQLTPGIRRSNSFRLKGDLRMSFLKHRASPPPSPTRQQCFCATVIPSGLFNPEHGRCTSTCAGFPGQTCGGFRKGV